MKNSPVAVKNRKTGKPLEVVEVGSISVPICRHTNIIPQRDAQGAGQKIHRSGRWCFLLKFSFFFL